MQGQITKFRDELGFGVIEAENGRKYRFSREQVVNLNGKLVGHEVDFEVSSARPKDIILLTGTPWGVFGRH